jgi:hypothetical protein
VVHAPQSKQSEVKKKQQNQSMKHRCEKKILAPPTNGWLRRKCKKKLGEETVQEWPVPS